MSSAARILATHAGAMTPEQPKNLEQMTDTPAIRNGGQLAGSSRMERAALAIGFCDQSQTKVTNRHCKIARMCMNRAQVVTKSGQMFGFSGEKCYLCTRRLAEINCCSFIMQHL